MSFNFSWRFSSAMQGDYEMLVGAARAIEIDAVCSVPHLPDDINQPHASKLLAEWALDDSLGQNEWQRRPDPSRIRAIKNFADASPQNLIVNSVMLYIPPDAKGVQLERDGEFVSIHIDMKEFLQPLGNKLTDVTVIEDNDGVKHFSDHRPIWLVDGQHRTRGLSLSRVGAEKRIPVILLHSDEDGGVSQNMVAKIFTEINTLSEDLDEYQARYLRFKHSIRASKREESYASPNEPNANPVQFANRRANRMAYELACRLNIVDSGPFESGVQLAKGPGQKRMSKVQVKTWHEVLRLWFTDGVYSDPSIDSDFVFNEMSDYFQAWSDTVNHDEYTFMPGVERWKPYFGGTKSTLERPNHVKKLMLLTFPWIRETMLAKQLTLDLAGFKEILSPLKYVDWHNTNFSSGSLISTGEDATNWLQIWIKQSMLNGNQWTLDDVNSTDPSLVNHGRALHASPSEPDFDFIVGAVTSTFQLTWMHGNVFTVPKVVTLYRPGHDDNDLSGSTTWEVIQNDPLLPSVFILHITVENSVLDTDGNGLIDEFDDWKLEVVATNLSPINSTTLSYSPSDLSS